MAGTADLSVSSSDFLFHTEITESRRADGKFKIRVRLKIIDWSFAESFFFSRKERQGAK
jgi:hypothetical protein